MNEKIIPIKSDSPKFDGSWFAPMPPAIAITGLFAAIMLNAGVARSADDPSYNAGVLTIPVVSTDDQVGRYQDVTMQLSAQGLWQLTGGRTVGGSPAVYLAPISEVVLIKNAEVPAQVFLRVSGTFPSGCGSPGRVSQRRVGNRFDTVLADGFQAYEVALCTAVMTPYVKTIPLPVYGLSAGTYSYSINGGVTGSFVLQTANEVPGDCLGSTACQK